MIDHWVRLFGHRSSCYGDSKTHGILSHRQMTHSSVEASAMAMHVHVLQIIAIV